MATKTLDVDGVVSIGAVLEREVDGGRAGRVIQRLRQLLVGAAASRRREYVVTHPAEGPPMVAQLPPPSNLHKSLLLADESTIEKFRRETELRLSKDGIIP